MVIPSTTMKNNQVEDFPGIALIVKLKKAIYGIGL